MARSPELITAQVACEAIANNPDAYEPDTIAAVIHTATYAGVSDFYLDMLKALPGTEVPELHPITAQRLTEADKARRSRIWRDEAYAGVGL